MRISRLVFFLCFCSISLGVSAQTDSLLSLVDIPEEKEYVTNAFKSSRVINNQSMEMIGKGVLDLRILHRFGLINSGINNFYGLDQASFRLGFDYGITKNLTVGVGRSTFEKELDGFVKWRIIQQSRGPKNSPISILWVGGTTVNTTPVPVGEDPRSVSDRTGYYYEVIIGRKFTEKFSMQLNPILVHRNRIMPSSEDDKNDVYGLGAGLRLKLTKHTAFVVDYDYILSGLDKNIYQNPLSIGFDIETGGHVFQVHFSNTVGMNENAFLTRTTSNWGKGEFNLGFNLSRVFNIKSNRTPKSK
jgi:hypothetical protein